VSRVVVPTPVRRYTNGAWTSRPDSVAGEEPLELRVGGRRLMVTMRTPGHDIELVHGYLHAEGVIASAADVGAAIYCDGVDDQGRNTYNVLDVTVRDLDDPDVRAALSGAERAGVTSSACGVCGSASIEALRVAGRYPLTPGAPVVDPDVIRGLPAALRSGQRTFRRTGGLHAASLASSDGTLGPVREDVGRHNAVDKVIGAALLANQLPASDRILVTSSRASFELVQKAVMAGVPMLVAVSAPSSLAVEVARAVGLTLIGFTRDDGFNIYAGQERVLGA
jgi:FdhD protein